MTPARPVTRVLVANRGEIVSRVARTAHAMGMAVSAPYTEADAAGPWLADVDLAVPLGGSAGARGYLDAGALLDAARRSGADAVHPGYGFLSENAGFARAVAAAGLIWVGPPPHAMATMGDKLAALAAMEAAGVPTLPRLTVTGDQVGLRARAEAVGLPLLVKASMGGGGKGMQLVTAIDELEEAVAAARREAGRAFADETVYLERWISPARHIEIQVLADADGHVVDLFERECSVQRRHQKVVEEAPSPVLDAALRSRIGAAAVAAAAAVGYRGAGTVEFVVDARGGHYFLEMNTRLQVEHGVTEAVTGVDLVRQQLLVAQGLPLDLPAQVRIDGAAIEVRLYAEDPSQGFLPASGRILRWTPPAGVRVEAALASGQEVSSHYDPMLAKLIAHAPTRREAAARLARALDLLRLHGPATNRAFLARVLRHPAFLAGDTTTDFIERWQEELVVAPAAEAIRRAAVAASMHARALELRAQPDRLPIPAGWRNNGFRSERIDHDGPGGRVTVTCREGRHGDLGGEANGRPFSASVRAAAQDSIDLELDGIRRRIDISSDGAAVIVQDDESEVRLQRAERFPRARAHVEAGSLVAAMNGVVVAVRVAPGQRVAAGETLVVLEAMKMEHRVTAPADGVVARVPVEVGGAVATGQVVVVVESDGAGEAGG